MQRYKLFSNSPNLPLGKQGNRIKIAKELIGRRRRRALQGRYSCIAQGASPGLIIETYLLSPKGVALPRRKTNARVIVPLLRSSILLFVRVYPGLHFGLCPHCTLGFAGVSCLKALIMCLDFDAVALLQVFFQARMCAHSSLKSNTGIGMTEQLQQSQERATP